MSRSSTHALVEKLLRENPVETIRHINDLPLPHVPSGRAHKDEIDVDNYPDFGDDEDPAPLKRKKRRWFSRG